MIQYHYSISDGSRVDAGVSLLHRAIFTNPVVVWYLKGRRICVQYVADQAEDKQIRPWFIMPGKYIDSTAQFIGHIAGTYMTRYSKRTAGEPSITTQKATTQTWNSIRENGIGP